MHGANMKIVHYCVHKSPPILCTYPQLDESPPRRFIPSNLRSSEWNSFAPPPRPEPRVHLSYISAVCATHPTIFHLIVLIITCGESSRVYHPQKLNYRNYGLLQQFSAVGVLCC